MTATLQSPRLRVMNPIYILMGRVGAIALLSVTSTCATLTSASAVSSAQPALLTLEQQAKLLEVGVKVVVPAYLPAGFQIDEIITDPGLPRNSSRPIDFPFYQITYRSSQGTCIQLGSGNHKWRDFPAKKTVVSTSRFGLVTVEYGGVKRGTGSNLTNIIQARLPGKDGYWLSSGKDDRKPCKSVSLQEYTRVLQSMDYLQGKTSR